MAPVLIKFDNYPKRGLKNASQQHIFVAKKRKKTGFQLRRQYDLPFWPCGVKSNYRGEGGGGEGVYPYS